MATKTKSYGTTIGYSSNGSSYTSLSDVIDIKPPNFPAAKIKVSHLESSDQTHEYVRGWIDPAEGTITGYFTKAQFNTLLGLLFSGTDDYYWKITAPLISGESTASTLVIRGHLSDVDLQSINIDDDGKITVDYKIQATKKPTFTAGS